MFVSLRLIYMLKGLFITSHYRSQIWELPPAQSPQWLVPDAAQRVCAAAAWKGPWRWWSSDLYYSASAPQTLRWHPQRTGPIQPVLQEYLMTEKNIMLLSLCVFFLFSIKHLVFFIKPIKVCCFIFDMHIISKTSKLSTWLSTCLKLYWKTKHLNTYTISYLNTYYWEIYSDNIKSYQNFILLLAI